MRARRLASTVQSRRPVAAYKRLRSARIRYPPPAAHKNYGKRSGRQEARREDGVQVEWER